VVIYFEGNPESSLQITAKNTLIDSSQIIRPIDSKFTAADSSEYKWKKGIFIFDKPVNQLSLQVKQTKQNSTFYIYYVQLLQMEKPGVVYHNFGVGGAQFSNLCKNASYSISQMKELQPDLIIFSYGSNESYTPTFRYQAYYDMVSSYIDQVKTAIPTTTIILTSPPDTRSKNRYPRNSDSIGIAFKNIAIEKNIAYWDLRSQMGGDGSLYKWLKLGLSSKDQLHFTKEGYKVQAKLFMEAFYRSFNVYAGEQQKATLPDINWPK
jgi:lysophospholipase L1-like esterase